MDLEISHTFGQVGLRTNWPYLKISQGIGSLQISREDTLLEVETSLGRLEVDGTSTWEDIGLYKQPNAFEEHYCQKYFNHGLEAIGEIAADGDYIAMIERGHTIPEYIERKTAPSEKEIDIKYKRGAEIEYTPSLVQFHSQLGRLDIKSGSFKPEKTFKPGGISVYLVEEGNVEINYRGEKMDIVV